MAAKIIGWITIIFSGICSAALVLYMVIVCLYINRNTLSKRILSKKRKKLLFASIICMVLLANLVLCAINLHNLSVYSYTSNDMGKDNEEYLEVLEKLPFNNETRNEEQTIWEHLICVELSYDEYLKWAEQATDFDALRELYQIEFLEVNKLPFIEVDELLEHANQFYGSEILPFTDKTLMDVEKEILPLNDRINTDVRVFQNEFWLRASNCSAESSDESLYQTGRAADDTFKVLINNKQGTFKEKVFNGSMAVGFYLASVKNYVGNIDLSLVYYKIAEIYIYFEKYVDFGEDDAIDMHCLLMAEIFLKLAEREYEKMGNTGDIHKELTYFSCYYAEILYKYIIVYKSDDDNLISKCSEYATQYLESSYSEKYPGCRDSCNNILENLVNRGYINKIDGMP